MRIGLDIRTGWDRLLSSRWFRRAVLAGRAIGGKRKLTAISWLLLVGLLGAWQEQQLIALADSGFRVRADEDDGVPIKICERGSWNCRFLVETVFSLVERVFHAKKLTHRTTHGIDMRLGFITACFNCLLMMTHGRLSFVDFVV